MSNPRKDAGQARQRPRQPANQQQAATRGAGPAARPAGTAPAFDPEAAQLAPRGTAPKGMISNPWVRNWAGATPGQSPRPAPDPEPRAGTGQQPGTRRAATDAGTAPKPPAVTK